MPIIFFNLSYTCRKMLYKQEVLQRPRLRERTKYSMLSAIHMFFSGGGRDSWSLVRRGSQPHSRNRQKSHDLHSRFAKLRPSNIPCNIPCVASPAGIPAGGPGLGGLIHEKARPCISQLIQSTLKCVDAGRINCSLVQQIPPRYDSI